MKKYIIGIDQGMSGAITILKNGEFVNSYLIEDSEGQFNAELVGKILLKYRKKDVFVYIEDVHSVYGASAKSNFTFGGAVHSMINIVKLLKIPHELVKPKQWQKISFNGVPVIKKATTKKGGTTNDTKKMASIAVKRLFPTVDLRKDVTPSSRCKVPHMGKVDSLLIAYYGSSWFKNGD